MAQQLSSNNLGLSRNMLYHDGVWRDKTVLKIDNPTGKIVKDFESDKD